MCFSFTKDVPRDKESLRTLPFVLQGALPPIFSVILNSQKIYLYGCKRQNNGSVLLTITLLVHRN